MSESSDLPGTKTLDYIGLGLLLAPPEVIVTVILVGSNVDVPKAAEVVIACLALGSALIWVSHKWQLWRSENGRVWPLLVAAENTIFGKAVIVGAAMAGALWLYASSLIKEPEVAILPNFSAVYAEFGSKLGSATHAQVGPGGLEVFETGQAVWVRDAQIVYRLRNNNKWDPRPHFETDDPNLANDTYVSQWLKLPPGQIPPNGGVAQEWHDDPADWNFLGSRRYWCGSQSLDYEVFENGFLIGELPTGNGTPGGTIYILFNNGTWQTRRAPSASACPGGS